MSESLYEARILLALQALQNDPKLSIRKAATIYQVNHCTLGRRQDGIQSIHSTTTKSRNLSDLEEQIIVQFILDLDSRGFPPRRDFVEKLANSLLADRDVSPVGKRWVHNFIQRQPELKTRRFRSWFRLVENMIAKYGIQLADIWNFDETGFMMGMIESGMVVTSSERRGRPKKVQPGNREWITVIEAINAEGQSIAPFIIGSGQYHLANWYRECDLPGDWVIALSENGWTNNQRGLDWLKHFDRSTKQPLDVGCFGPLKKAYGREIERLIRCSITHISKTEFFPAFYAAHLATITESNILGGFRGAGLAPLDPENVISKMDVQLRTPTPPTEVTAPSTPWASRTPKTVLEAQSHSKYLKARIVHHKSSSPESMLEAVGYFEKGCRTFLHEISVLKERVQQLEQANRSVGRRRRGKRNRIQKGGPLIIEDASQAIDQMDVDTQVVAESSRSGGQGSSGQPRVRHCGTCGKTGHNARTCQEEIEVNMEEYSD
ncbi:transposase [Fusarium oxysporum f. sp. phaseoli]